MNNQKGFTLIEVLVTIAIIGLLASIIFASISTAREKAIVSKNIQQGQEVKKSAELSRLGSNISPISMATHEQHLRDGTNTLQHEPYNTIFSTGGNLSDSSVYGDVVESDVEKVPHSVSPDTRTKSPYRYIYNPDELINIGEDSEEYSLLCISENEISEMAFEGWQWSEGKRIPSSDDIITYSIVEKEISNWNGWNQGKLDEDEKVVTLIRTDFDSSHNGNTFHTSSEDGGIDSTNLGFLGLDPINFTVKEQMKYPYQTEEYDDWWGNGWVRPFHFYSYDAADKADGTFTLKYLPCF